MDVIINANLDVAPEGSASLPSHHHFYHNLLCSLGYPANHPPVADLLRRVHGLEGRWLVASPMSWHATHNDAMIMACEQELNLSEEEAHLWFAAFTEFAAHDAMTLYYHDAHTWLLQYDGKPDLVATPVHTLLQQSLMPELARLDKTSYWQRFITECQMYLSAHAANAKRRECEINGMWFWGNGTLHAPSSTSLVSDESAWDVATLLSTQVSGYPSNASYSRNSVFVLGEFNAETVERLKTQLQQHTVRWYWNNLAYTSKPKSRFCRLWRSLCR